jgi:hypothetical protein
MIQQNLTYALVTSKHHSITIIFTGETRSVSIERCSAGVGSHLDHMKILAEDKHSSLF